MGDLVISHLMIVAHQINGGVVGTAIVKQNPIIFNGDRAFSFEKINSTAIIGTKGITLNQ